MANRQNWEQLYEIAQGSDAAKGEGQRYGAMRGSDIGRGQGSRVDVAQLSSGQGNSGKMSIDPAGITQSYYTEASTADNYETGRPTYEQSQAVQDAAANVQSKYDSKPEEYESQYQQQIQQLIDQALNREKFHYDYSADPIYQMYADKYQTQGQAAMKGAMANAAALTGGYGSSWGQQVGQQTYQQYLQSLNDIIPELRDEAYEQYMDEGDRMYQNLSMLQTEDDRDYGKYRDTVTDWKDELNFLYTMYTDMSDAEYERYMNDSAAWEADRAYWYQKAYDEQQQKNWEKEFAAKYGSSSGGGGGGRKSSGGKDKGTTIYVPSGSGLGTDSSRKAAIELAKLRNSKK